MVNRSWYSWNSGDLLISLQVQARASADKFAELIGDRIKLRVKAPAIENRANEAIIKFLSREFKTTKSRVQILSGHTSSKKLVRVQSPERLPQLPGLTEDKGGSPD